MSEPSKSDILAAIADLRTHLDCRIDGVRDDLNAKIDGVRDDLNAKIDGVRDELNAKMGGVRDELNAKIDGVRSELAAFREESRIAQAVASARLDEQPQTVNALIPTQLAAVPGRAAG